MFMRGCGPASAGRRRGMVLAVAAALASSLAADPAGDPAGTGVPAFGPAVARPGGTARGSLPGPAAEFTAALGGMELPLSPRLPAGSRFVAEYEGVEAGFVDLVLFENREFGRLDPGGSVIAVDLPDEALGSEDLRISVSAGGPGAAFSPYVPFGAVDRDDFVLRAPALELPDGRRLSPKSLIALNGSGSLRVRRYSASAPIALGDGDVARGEPDPGLPGIVSFEFEVPADFMTEFEIDLGPAVAAEGEVEVLFRRSADALREPAEAAAGAAFPTRLFLDATPPELRALGPEPGSAARGDLSLDAEARDPGSGVAAIEASLDGTAVALPFRGRALDLPPGEHLFALRARDRAGNAAERALSFRTEDEAPYPPRILRLPTGPGAGRVSVELRDPQGDELRAELRRGLVLGPADARIRAFAGFFDLERPDAPRMKGELPLDPRLLADDDGALAETRAAAGFPGHRFELEIPPMPAERVRVAWEGRTLPGRSLSAWAWDYVSGAWALKAEGREGPLAWDLDPAREIRGGRAEVLVMDPPAASERPFTLAWITDPQYYAANFPAVYESMAAYLAESYRAGEIAYLVDTGDVVDKAVDAGQWLVADRAMQLLDEAGLPYGVAAGNHDVQQEDLVYDTFLHYFGDARADRRGYASPGGSWRGGIHRYDLVSFCGRDFLFLYLGYGFDVDPEGLDWARSVLAAHPDRVAVICLHAYLNAGGSRLARAEPVFRGLVEPFPNVALVLCGHIHGAARARRALADASGGERVVHELLSDYQSGPMGGSGFLRLLRFDPARGTLSVSTLSPVTGEKGFFPGDQDEFELAFPLPGPEKLIATDSIRVEVYGAEVVDRRDGVPAGATVEMAVPPGSAWYLVVEDGLGARASTALFAGW